MTRASHLRSFFLSFYVLVSLNQVIAERWEEHFNNDWTDNFKPFHSLWGGGNHEFQADNSSNRNSLFIRDQQLYIKPTLTDELYPNFRCPSSVGCENQDPKSFVQCQTSELSFHNAICSTRPEDKSYFEYGCAQKFYPKDKCSDDSENMKNIVPPVQSARIKTLKAFGYGTLEVTARIPQGDWLWPIIYQLPETNKYGDWPRSGATEIMTSKGHSVDRPYKVDGGVNGNNEIGSSLHWGVRYDQSKFQLTHKKLIADKLGLDSFHEKFLTYGIYRTPNKIQTYVKNCPLGCTDTSSTECKKEILVDVDTTIPFCTFGKIPEDKCPWKDGPVNAPFEQKFNLVLTVAVGGTNGYFKEHEGSKRWKNDAKGKIDFYKYRDDWYPTWNGDDVALIIDSITYDSEYTV